MTMILALGLRLTRRGGGGDTGVSSSDPEVEEDIDEQSINELRCPSECELVVGLMYGGGGGML